MSEFGPSPTHPLGWAFLGSGAILWILPLLILLQVQPSSLLPSDNALRLALLVIAASVLGILLEQLLSRLERLFLRTVKFQAASSEDWAIAWQTRWKYSIADSEFRRHEALASFGRAYALHFTLGAVLWAWAACLGRELSLAVASVIAGPVLAFVSYRVWRRHTGLIVRLVLSAAKWRRGKALD